MVNCRKYLATAVLQTGLGVAVVWRYGGAIWSAWSGIIWARLLLILLLTMMLTSLLRVWYRAGYALQPTCQKRSCEAVSAVAATRKVLRGEGDV